MTPALEQIKALLDKLPNIAILDAVDDTALTGNRPLPVTLTLAEWRMLRTALQALRDEAGEAVYQHEIQPGRWADIVYEDWMLVGEAHKRIVYTRPAPAAEAVPQEGVSAPRAPLTITSETAADVLHRYLANAPDGDHWPPERQRELRIEAMRNAVANALEAALAAGPLPHGMVLVPKEPTTVMVNAGVDADDLRTGFETVRHIYTAMLAAAPAQGVR